MAIPPPSSILLALPLLKWRGVTWQYYDAAPVSVTHSQAERVFPYVDGAGHDNTGRDPIKMNFRLMFYNTLTPSAFPSLFEQWRDLLLDGGPGDLVHPILGPMRARVMSFDIVADANQTTAGVSVNVTWTDTVDNPAAATNFSPLQLNATTIAQTADSQLSDAGIDFPEGGPANLADLFQQVDGLIFSATLSIGGLINQAKGTIAELVDRVEARDDPALWAIRTNLITLYDATLDIQDRLGAAAARQASTSTFPFPTTFGRIARETGNTVGELMTLNQSLLTAPQIPAGTPIKFYADAA
jgi:prophage DNA circulation protein